MSTGVVLLVHGAMHGGWCWRPVERLLRADGYDVFTPTLTGQGERAHLLTPEVGIATHVDDLLAVLRYEDLRDVHLAVHSYAGVLAGPVVDGGDGRITRVTFLGAFVVEPGECLLDVEPPEIAAKYRSRADARGDGWRVPTTPAFLDQWGVTDPALRELVGSRLTDFPLRCATDPVDYSADAFTGVPCAYVRHTDPPLASLDLAYDRAVAKGWPTREVACGHDMMLDDPEATVAALLSGRSAVP